MTVRLSPPDLCLALCCVLTSEAVSAADEDRQRKCRNERLPIHELRVEARDDQTEDLLPGHFDLLVTTAEHIDRNQRRIVPMKREQAHWRGKWSRRVFGILLEDGILLPQLVHSPEGTYIDDLSLYNDFSCYAEPEGSSCVGVVEISARREGASKVGLETDFDTEPTVPAKIRISGIGFDIPEDTWSDSPRETSREGCELTLLKAQPWVRLSLRGEILDPSRRKPLEVDLGDLVIPRQRLREPNGAVYTGDELMGELMVSSGRPDNPWATMAEKESPKIDLLRRLRQVAFKEVRR